MAPIPTEPSNAPKEQAEEALPPRVTHAVGEHRFISQIPIRSDGYVKARSRGHNEAAVVIDNGSSCTRAGWSFETQPRLQLPPIFARYRERKLNKTMSFVGADVYADTVARSHMRSAFEVGSGVVCNWDVMEAILDYSFIKVGVDGAQGGVDVPIVMTEAVANLPYSRRTMSELLFECYSAPSVAYGIDSLFSYRYNGGSTGLVVSSSHTSTHVIPVLHSKALLTQAARLNWGGSHTAEYLFKLLRLKYPHLDPRCKLSATQTEYMVRDHCYLAQNYGAELGSFLDWTGLEDRDIVLQYPFTEEVVVQKSEEELAIQAQKKLEAGQRLREQNAKRNLEKLVKNEEELEYYKHIQNRIADANKKESKRILDAEEMKDEKALERVIKELEIKIRKKRIGGPEIEEEVEEPDYSLLEVPDEQLDEAGLKQKRHQRLMKSNHDARARAKAEKEQEKARIAKEQRLDEEKRENDLASWLRDRHAARAAMVQRIRDRDRLRADLGNRKSLASQNRMKSIANLASDNPGKKRRRGGDEDNFGANDDDWHVYRQIGTNDGSDDDEEEDLGTSLRNIEAELLKYDPDFDEQQTLDAQTDWTKSLLHAFLRGPRPFDVSSQMELHQIHLNVERIRVPEVLFQPGIAGVDQAGLLEIAANVLNQRLLDVAGPGMQDAFLKDIFLTGGNTLFRNFDERLRAGLSSSLPAGADMVVRKAEDPMLDAWKGAAKWTGSDQWRAARITKEEYAEKGADYIKEHNLGNACV